MRNKKSAIIKTILLLLVLPFAIWVAVASVESNHQRIKDWASEHNYEVISIDQTWIDNGPFWFVDEDDTVYKVRLKDHYEKEHTFYFKVSFWRVVAKEKK